jgi:hypothetical protein
VTTYDLMTHRALLTMHNLALLSDWLSEQGELWVDVHLPHAPASSDQYFINSLEDLRSLLQDVQWPEIALTIKRLNPYRIAGCVDSVLTDAALQSIPESAPFAIVALPSRYPARCELLGSGTGHEQLRQFLLQLNGREVGVGIDPTVYDPGERMRTSDNFVLTLTRNHNHYEPFAANPERYDWIRSLWLGH